MAGLFLRPNPVSELKRQFATTFIQDCFDWIDHNCHFAMNADINHPVAHPWYILCNAIEGRGGGGKLFYQDHPSP